MATLFIIAADISNISYFLHRKFVYIYGKPIEHVVRATPYHMDNVIFPPSKFLNRNIIDDNYLLPSSVWYFCLVLCNMHDACIGKRPLNHIYVLDKTLVNHTMSRSAEYIQYSIYRACL